MLRKIDGLLCLLVCVALSGCVVVTPQDLTTYSWSLLQDSETGDEWELWYDVPPNRAFRTFGDLRESQSIEYSSGAYFEWTDDCGAIAFGSLDGSKFLGIRTVDRSIPYLGETELRVTVLLELLTGKTTFEIYYYESNGVFLGNQVYELTGVEPWNERIFVLEPPAETSSFAMGIVMGNCTGRIAFKEIVMSK